MAVWSKLMTALRGNANALGESIVDSQAMVILDEEIRNAGTELNQAKLALAEIMAKHRVATDKLTVLKGQVTEYEDYALAALEKGKEDLAQEVALKIANIETELAQQQEIVDHYGKSVDQLRTAVQSAEGNLKRLRQQADTVLATESVQRAQAAVASRYAGGQAKLQTAMDSLERIKMKQAENAARMESAQELEAESRGDVLTEKLRAAGITPQETSATNVLNRLKEKQQTKQNNA
ncbi:PspA/IM30 family protein [Nitrincola iocasae]|uniref:PspA/IM30 family protein n=1 Tax=Nitrincola iocasae TaxID=2614693 RepID=A0A5J6LI27_9GAMM|nr:PspA/IM30 family protein [Nitrincola iocasae]QEW08033.1 PspA/IM30 family protein [Nitrincola iocasae]